MSNSLSSIVTFPHARIHITYEIDYTPRDLVKNDTAPAIEHVFQTNQAPLTVRNNGCYSLWRHVRLLWIELGHSLRSSLVKQQFISAGTRHSEVACILRLDSVREIARLLYPESRF